MSQPTTKDVHVDAAMTHLSLAYRNRGYVAERVLAPVNVLKQSDRYFIFAKGAWFRDEAGLRAPSSRAPRGGYTVSTDTYFCNEWAFAKEVPDELRENADAPLNPDQEAVDFATEKVLLRKERAVAGLILDPAKWANSEDAEGLWAAGSGNTFIADVERAIDTVRRATGRRPNVMVMDAGTLKDIKQEDTVLSRIKYSERGIVTPDLIAAMFDLEEVLVGEAIYSSAEEKADGSDFSSANIWERNAGKGSACLLWRPAQPGIMVPAAGYTFTWKPRVIRRWREEAEHQDVIECAESFEPKVTGADLGFLFYDTTLT
jgi:hypothetical protein